MQKLFKSLIIFAVGICFSSNLYALELKGFIDLRYDAQTDKVFVTLEKEKLDTPFIFQSSLPHGVGSNDIGLDRGQLGDTRLVQFERYGNKIMLKQLNTQYRSSANNALERESIDQAFADSILAGFVVHEENDTLIEFDYTAFLFSDIHDMAQRLKSTEQGVYTVDTSRSGVYLPKTKAFPLNTEIEAVVTFTGEAKGAYIKQVTPDADEVTVHMHHSFIALPDDDYQPRKYHPYSGFFKQSFYDYSVPINAQMEQKYIRRHRLAKKDPTAAVSEAVEPIVYYLDPGVPEPVYSALLEGAMWWNQAFEAAGYKNAFQVKALPEGADPMDVRYNIIQWVHRATRGWSYGYSVFDPRTGEILKGHVTLGSLRVRQDYLIALGLTSPFTTETASTESQLQMALNRIKQLSAHEIGHTIGIAHNFAASENDRASVMDYPHPLIQIKNGKIDLSNAYDDGIGEWDKYVVKYGYQDFPINVNENNQLSQMASQAKESFLFISDPDARSANRPSSHGHLWDNGQDPVDAFEHILKVREIALSNFGNASLPFGEAYSSLEERLVPIYYAHRYQIDALVKQVGGLNYEYSQKTNANTNQVVTLVAPEKQRKALEWMIESATADFLSLPDEILRLIPPKSYGSERSRESAPSRFGIAFDPLTLAEAAAGNSISKLLTAERLNRLDLQHQQMNDIPSIEQLLEMVFENWVAGATKSGLQSRVGLMTLSQLFDLLQGERLAPELKLHIEAKLLSYHDSLSKSRNKKSKVLAKHINEYWRTGDFRLKVNVRSLPPGSPI